MSLQPGIFGGGPSWLPQGQRSDPFGSGGLLGGQSGWRGLLGNQNLALALLANSGYSPQKRSFGEILGTSALQARQMGQQSEEADLMRRYREAQIKSLETPRTGNAPSSVQEYEYAKQNGFKGSFQDWIVAGGQSSRPSAVQEWEHFNALSPQDQDKYLLMKRAQMQKVEELAGGKAVVSASPMGNVTTTGLTSLPQEAAAAETVKQAEGRGGAVGKTQGEITGGILTKGSNARSVLGMIDEAEKIIDKATGSSGGALVDTAAATVGKSTEGAKAIAQLKVLQAGLMLNMPRMEGPQSDRDVQLYREAAASLGEPNVPRDTKKAALQTIRALQERYKDRARQINDAPTNNSDPLGIRR